MPDRLGKASYSRQLFRRLARYEHESDGEHLLDALFEDEDDDECETTVVYYGR